MPVPWIVLFGMQWISIVVLSVLVLGLSQRVTASMAARHAVPAGSGLLDTVPPVGTRLPRERELLAPADERGRTAIVFLSSACGPCRSLSDSLLAASDDTGAGGMLDIGDELVVVTDPAGSEAFARLGRIIVDHDGELNRALGVKVTPVGFGVEQDGTLLATTLLREVKDVVALISTDSRPVLAT